MCIIIIIHIITSSSTMNLSSSILRFVITIMFCPLDPIQLLSSTIPPPSPVNNSTQRSRPRSVAVRRQTSSSSSSLSSKTTTFGSSSSLSPKLRIKRTISLKIPRPGKWEPIINELFHKTNGLSSTRFYLYTRHNPDTGHELCIDDWPSLQQSFYDPNKRTVFLINGWQDNRFLAKWVREGIRLLLVREDQNVIYVSWRSLKELFVAAMIIRSYSNYLAEFINFLKHKYQINGEQIHCIGHSLGGFMCGFAGSLTYIGRVTVLDAGPRPYYQPRPPQERLNRFQAGFMDVIHSDFNPTFSLGLTIPYGDLDFFPNAGTVQPGCWRDKWYKAWQELKDEGPIVSLFQIPRYLLFCSHYRSHEWFFESIANEQCQFVGVLCPTYQMFIDGECSCDDIVSDGHGDSTCALMGYDAEYAVLKQKLNKFSPQGRWFLKTSDFLQQNDRHCQYQYQLMVQLGQFIPTSYNASVLVTIVAQDHRRQYKILSQETLKPRQPVGKPEMQPKHRLTKLILKPQSFPLSQIVAVYVSLSMDTKLNRHFFITIPWIKLSPIHVVNNEPIFFCHLNHFLRPGTTRQLKRCPNT